MRFIFQKLWPIGANIKNIIFAHSTTLLIRSNGITCGQYIKKKKNSRKIAVWSSKLIFSCCRTSPPKPHGPILWTFRVILISNGAWPFLPQACRRNYQLHTISLLVGILFIVLEECVPSLVYIMKNKPRNIKRTEIEQLYQVDWLLSLI